MTGPMPAVQAVQNPTLNTPPLLPSAVRTATQTLLLANPQSRGIHVVLDVTVVPGTDTVKVGVYGYDPASGKNYTILESTASATTGTVVLKVFPGATQSNNAAANDCIPHDYKIIVTHSAASNFTYSLGASLLA